MLNEENSRAAEVFTLEAFLKVKDFNTSIIGINIPNSPSLLNDERSSFRQKLLMEEIEEFKKACKDKSLEDCADAMVDLIYVALGTLVEMGVPCKACFEEVHDANMKKERGSLTKRPGSSGFDAVKPKGWEPPNIIQYLTLSKEELFK